MAGNFAVWSGMFNAFECSFSHYREKEDAWNSVMSGAATGAVLAMRQGPVAMALSGFIGGVFLGAMEGAGVMMGKMTGGGSIDPQPYPDAQQQAQQQQAQSQSSDANEERPRPRGLFTGRFGF
jgi:import inner membrane translocase subunit TIM17